MNIVEIKGLRFSYGKKEIFNNFSLEIEQGKWYSVLGKNGVGKTTFAKILSGMYLSDSIIVDGMKLNKANLYEIKKVLAVVFEEIDDNFVFDTVREEIFFALDSFNIKASEKEIQDILEKFTVENIFNKKTSELTNEEKQILSIVLAVLINPKIIVLDNAFVYINDKETIIKLLKELKLTIINITEDIEETLYGDNIIILNDKKVLLNEPCLKVYNEELLSLANQKLPFIISLSRKLQYYEIINKDFYSIEKLVGEIWK